MEAWAKDFSSLSLSFPQMKSERPILGSIEAAQASKLGAAFVMACGKAVGFLEEGALTCEDGFIKDQDEPREEIPLHLDV